MTSVKRKQASTDSSSSDTSSTPNRDSPQPQIESPLTEYEGNVSDLEEKPVKKRSKFSNGSQQYELQNDLKNYGTAASQRPTRVRHQATAVDLATQTPQEKVQQTERESASIPKAKPTTSKVKTRRQVKPQKGTDRNTRSRMKRAMSEEGATQQVHEDKPTIGCLKVPLDRLVEHSPPQHSSQPQKDPEPTGVQVSQPSSLHSQESNALPEDIDNSSLKDSQEQCAQQVLAPIPAASSQDSVSPNASQPVGEPNAEFMRDCWVPQTPEDSPSHHLKNLPREVFATPRWVHFQEVSRVPAPPTPTSAPRPVTGAVQGKEEALEDEDSLVPTQLLNHTQPTLPLSITWNVPSPTAVAGPTVTYADSEATTEYEEALEPCDEPNHTVEETQLRTIAEQLFASRNSGLTKPEPSGHPEVWAEGRQELCETLHYYRSYQGACYSTGGFVRGFMFDKVAHARDYTDSNVVISRAGGGLLKDKDSGEMKAGRDQVEDSVAQALRSCMSHYNPVVIITGTDNPHIPSKPPHQYCVLDYFKPTHIWVEKSGDSKIVRYRFEKLNTGKDSWWQPKDTQDPVELGSLPPPAEEACEACGKQSPQVYLNGWMCLQPACASFWKISVPASGSACTKAFYEPDEASLIYDPRFLKQKTPWHNDHHEYPLISNNAQLSGYSIPGEDTSQAFWLGMVCPECGRCTSRLGWMGWECSNLTCNFKKEPPHTLIPARSLREPLWPLTNSYTLSRDTQSPLISLRVSFSHGYRINRYDIPGIDGFITHMIANKTVLEESGGPDAMFEELQQTDIGLRRRSMPNGQLKGPNYCRHFTVNYGMPYKFIAATASHSFAEAARPITSTRSRLNWVAKLLLTQETGKSMDEISEERKDKEFNEVLALGYFEQQKINYHDDGEHGLGPTIATLSLGAPGTMRIRMKARHYHGVSSAGVYDDAPPIPGCQQYDARLELQPSLEALKQSDSKAYTAKRKQIPKDLKLKSSGQAKDILNMQLGHGDIVVMHGADLQKYYEHAVEHAGKLRFALTCRYIDPESLKPEDKPSYEVEPDLEGYDGSGLGEV